MGSIAASPVGGAVRSGLFLLGAVLFLIYLLTIVWVVRDARGRGASWVGWGACALVPFVGPLVYTMMRPSTYLIDRDEQELDLALKQRQMMNFGECPKCGFPTEADYVACPRCKTRLKATCPSCGKPVQFGWNCCPYCAWEPGKAERRGAQPHGGHPVQPGHPAQAGHPAQSAPAQAVQPAAKQPAKTSAPAASGPVTARPARQAPHPRKR